MKFLIPVTNCVVTSRFNDKRIYPAQRKQLHEGLDLAPIRNEEIIVKAAQMGQIVFIGYDPHGYGNYIIIKHDTRYSTLYGHLQEVIAFSNQLVMPGDSIGVMGSTGNSTGKHLHLNIIDQIAGLNNYVYPKVVDPQPLLVNKIDTLLITDVCYNIVKEIL